MEILTIACSFAVPVLCSPIVPWVLSAILLVLMEGRLGSVRRQIRQQNRQQAEDWALVKQTCRRLEDLMLDAERRLEESEERSAQLVPPPTARSGLNLTKRTQAARMFRRGDQPEQIAAALSLPRNEVDLLLKVQKTAAGG